MLKNFLPLIFISLLITINPYCCNAQEKKSGGDLRAAVQNPVGAMYSLPFKFNFDYGAPNGEASFLNIQPVIPITVGDWNLINRVIAPIIDTPGQVTGTPEIRFALNKPIRDTRIKLVRNGVVIKEVKGCELVYKDEDLGARKEPAYYRVVVEGPVIERGKDDPYITEEANLLIVNPIFVRFDR